MVAVKMERSKMYCIYTLFDQIISIRFIIFDKTQNIELKLYR